MTRTPMTIWVVDPISYSGMAYTDVGQVASLRRLEADATLVGSEGWMLPDEIVPRIEVFRGTHGGGARWRRGAAYGWSLLRLVARVARARPDVVHWQFTELPIADLLAVLAIRAMGIPQVYTAHELLPWSQARHHRWLFSRLYAVLDAIVVHNEDQERDICARFGVSPAKVHVVPLGDYASFATPDRPQQAARARLGIDPAVPVALFFGTIRPSKGLEVLLEAWQAVSRALPDARLLVAGRPFKRLDTGVIDALIARLGIGNSVQTTFEHVGPDVANDFYRAADVVVLPYHDIGTSGVLRYAYNSRRPVIATTVGEHRNRVIEGETGYLVPPGAPHVLAETLERALGDRPGLEAMGRAAERYTDRHFDWLNVSRELLRIYEGLTD